MFSLESSGGNRLVLRTCNIVYTLLFCVLHIGMFTVKFVELEENKTAELNTEPDVQRLERLIKQKETKKCK